MFHLFVVNCVHLLGSRLEAQVRVHHKVNTEPRFSWGGLFVHKSTIGSDIIHSSTFNDQLGTNGLLMGQNDLLFYLINKDQSKREVFICNNILYLKEAGGEV